MNNQGIPKCWDVTKWELGGVGRIAVITDELPTVRVYKASSPNSSEGNVTLKEEYNFNESDTSSVIINDVAIHANILVYSTTNMDTSQNYLKVVNISSNLKEQVWKLQIPSVTSLMNLSVTSSAFLGIYQNRDIIMCSLEEFLEQFRRSDNDKVDSDDISHGIPMDPDPHGILQCPIFKSNDSLCNKSNTIVRPICLDHGGSVAFLSDGNGDTLRVYTSASVVHQNREMICKVQHADCDNVRDSCEEITSLC